MSAYTTYDFHESLDRVGLLPEMIERVVRAWGNGGPTEWEGGFVMKLRDGRFAYLWGWNDYSGWGCQDGAEVEYFETEPDWQMWRGVPQHMGGLIPYVFGGHTGVAEGEEWDEDPIDLNRYLADPSKVEYA